MIEICLNKVKKTFGFKNVLDGLDLVVKTNEKVSLIGENGCGKSTILKIINKLECVDEGTVAIKNSATIAYLTQEPESIYSDKKVVDILYESLEEIIRVGNQLKSYELKMANDPNNIDIINKYLNIQQKYIDIGGYEVDTLIEKVSHGLNIDYLLEKDFNYLSGGEQKRVVLASIIINKPDILLLDEPTNHLDITSLEWLEDYLIKYSGTVVIVSHDRYFLDKVTNKTVLIENGRSIVFNGNYSKYLIENEVRIEKEFKEYKDQQKIIAAMKKKIKQLENFGKLAYPGGELFFRRAENIRKRLERIDLLNKPIIKKELPLNLDINTRSGNDVLVINNYDLKINDKLLINNINVNINYKDKVCLIGDNGCGKTTLIKRILENDTCNIKVGSNTNIGYIPQQILFKDDVTVLDYSRNFFNGEEHHLRSALNKFYFHGDNVFKKVSKLSGGERVRLVLFTLIQQKCNFIILDEPTNHIDIFTKESLEEALNDFEGTVLFVSHDRYFINKLANKILYIHDNSVTLYNGNYDYFKTKSTN